MGSWARWSPNPWQLTRSAVSPSVSELQGSLPGDEKAGTGMGLGWCGQARGTGWGAGRRGWRLRSWDLDKVLGDRLGGGHKDLRVAGQVQAPPGLPGGCTPPQLSTPRQRLPGLLLSASRLSRGLAMHTPPLPLPGACVLSPGKLSFEHDIPTPAVVSSVRLSVRFRLTLTTGRTQVRDVSLHGRRVGRGTQGGHGTLQAAEAQPSPHATHHVSGDREERQSRSQQ